MKFATFKPDAASARRWQVFEATASALSLRGRMRDVLAGTLGTETDIGAWMLAEVRLLAPVPSTSLDRPSSRWPNERTFDVR